MRSARSSWMLAATAALVLALALALAGAPGASAAPTTSTRAGSAPSHPPSTPAGTAAVSSEAPIPVPPSEVPPAARRLSADAVLAIAAALPKMRKSARNTRAPTEART